MTNLKKIKISNSLGFSVFFTSTSTAATSLQFNAKRNYNSLNLFSKSRVRLCRKQMVTAVLHVTFSLSLIKMRHLRPQNSIKACPVRGPRNFVMQKKMVKYIWTFSDQLKIEETVC